MLLAMHLETSPHTRGKLPLVLKMLAGLGNIPAYAGKAACLRWLDRSRWKHPRIRGESQSISRLRLMLLGNIPAYAGKAGFFCSPLNFCQETSPHTRGKRLGKKGSVKKPGNIPAYAGKALSFDQLNDKQ